MNITDVIVLIAIWAGARLATTANEHWLSLLDEMYAPMDEEGVRHPGHGVLTLGEYATLANYLMEQSDEKSGVGDG